MAQKFKNQIDAQEGIKITNELYDGSNAAGTSGQVLSSTGSATQWIDSNSETAERIEVTVKNVSGGSLSKGTVVHAAPTATPPSGNVIEVIAADYDTASAMPAIGVLNETIADEAEGAAVMMGAVSGIDTDSFNIGDELYVGNAGAFINSKPTANNQLIQKMAVVIKKHASNGLIKVFGAGRSNDVPNQIDRDVNFTDNSKLTFGDSTTPDLEIYHDGSDVKIENSTGDIKITQNTDDGLIRFYNDSGSGQIQPYVTLDGSVKQTKFTVDTLHPDNFKALFGTGSDLQIYHNAFNSYINNSGTGDLIFTNGLNATLTIDGSSGNATFSGDIIGSGNLNLRSYNNSGKGIFFRDGFEYGDGTEYNLSITVYDDGDGAADALEINAHDGIYFNTGSNSQNIRAKIDTNGIATFYGDYISINDNGYIRGDDSGYLHFQNGSNGTRFYNYGNSVEILRIDNNYDLGIGYDQAITNTVLKTFASAHASGNRGAELHFGIHDGSFGGIQVKNIASSSSAYNSQFIEFHTHEGGVVADMAMRILPKGEVQIIDENGGNSKLQVRNFATTSTGSFTDNYMVEFRSVYTTGATAGALLVHTEEVDDTRPTMVVSDSTGVFATFVNQKVAIGGTHTPSYALDVNSGTSNVVARFESTDGTAAIMLKDNAGNVELSNSGSSFQVQPSGGTATFIAESNGRIRATDGTRALYIGAWDGTNNRIEGSSGHNIFMTSYSADINFGISGSTKMTLKSNGQLNLTTKPNSGLAYDVLINVGTSPDGVVGYQTVDQLAANIGASTSSNWVKSGNNIYNTNSGNVGVSVTSPSTKLEILSSQTNSSIKTGGLEMQSYAVNNSWYAENLYYDGNWRLRSNGYATQIYMAVGEINFNRVASGSAGDIVSPQRTMTLDSSGNMGIGYQSPSVFNQRVNAPHLVVGSGSNASGVTIFSGTNDQGSINFADGTSTTDQYTGGIVYVHGSNNYMSFHTNGGTQRMRIDSAGNVGVNCTPEQKFMVRTGTAYTGHTGSAIKITNQGYRDSELTSFTEGGYFTHYFENFTGGNGRYYDRVLEIVCKGSPDGTYGEGVIKFMANPITSGSGVSEIMRITGNKWVGINTKTKAVYGGAGMDVTGAAQTGIRVSSSTSGGGALEMGADSSGSYFQNVVVGDKTTLYTSVSAAADTINTTFLGGHGVSIGGTGTNGTRLDLIGGAANQMNISNATGNWGLLFGFGDGSLSSNYHGLNHAAIINVQNQTLHLGANNNSWLKILGNGEITHGITGLEVISIKANRINSGYSDAANDSDIWINYEGYQNDTSYYRDFRIGNGRGGQIAWADGSTNKFGINTTYLFSKLQQGQPTFDGYNGMYNDDRVGISNHGSLTGLMLASTYNDATYPEYGLVFIQGPSTSSYNVWSLSPDGPAAGDSLNFIYQAQSSNIHAVSPRFIMDGNGDFHADGDIIAYSSTASDERLKNNIITIDNALDKVKKLRGVSFVWNNGKRKDQKDIGVIAQEVEKVIPEIVYEKELSTFSHEKDIYKTVDYEKLTAVLIESVKELSAKVEALENRNCNCK